METISSPCHLPKGDPKYRIVRNAGKPPAWLIHLALILLLIAVPVPASGGFFSPTEIVLPETGSPAPGGWIGPVVIRDRSIPSERAGGILPVHQILAEGTFSGVTGNRSAVLTARINPPLTHVKTLAAPDMADFDYFGISVAVDEAILVAGAHFAGAGGMRRGQVYVFSRDRNGTDKPGAVEILSDPDPSDPGYFGYAVAVDGTTLVVGAPGSDSNRGKAYVLNRDHGGTGNWSIVKALSAADMAAGDNFGWSLAIDGSMVVVGAPGTDNNRGKAYLFNRDHGGTDNWGMVNVLSAPDREDGDNFGWSVAIDGSTAVVGAFRAGPGGAGQAYVFTSNPGSADPRALVKTLYAPDREDGDNFGWSVAVDGSTAVVGAYRAGSGGTDRGKAYIFSRDYGDTGSWEEAAVLFASDRADGDKFGSSVAVDGRTVIVGAPGAASGDTGPGQVYLFTRDYRGAETWDEAGHFTAPDMADNDEFGWSVAVDGSTVISGAPAADCGGTNRGQAFIFTLDPAPAYSGNLPEPLPDNRSAAVFGNATSVRISHIPARTKTGTGTTDPAAQQAGAACPASSQISTARSSLPASASGFTPGRAALVLAGLAVISAAGKRKR